jgi:hypothetical protein
MKLYPVGLSSIETTIEGGDVAIRLVVGHRHAYDCLSRDVLLVTQQGSDNDEGTKSYPS